HAVSAYALWGEERFMLCSPIGLQVIDAFLNAAPIFGYRVRVDFRDGMQWTETSLLPTRTPSGVLTLPGVGRCPYVTPGQAPQRYRLRIESADYIPDYRRNTD